MQKGPAGHITILRLVPVQVPPHIHVQVQYKQKKLHFFSTYTLGEIFQDSGFCMNSHHNHNSLCQEQVVGPCRGHSNLEVGVGHMDPVSEVHSHIRDSLDGSHHTYMYMKHAKTQITHQNMMK